MTKYMVSQSEENWKLWGAASGEVCMAGARHDGTGTCICNVKEGGWKNVAGSRVPSTSAHCGIACGGVLAVWTKAGHRRPRPTPSMNRCLQTTRVHHPPRTTTHASVKTDRRQTACTETLRRSSQRDVCVKSFLPRASPPCGTSP